MRSRPYLSGMGNDTLGAEALLELRVLFLRELATGYQDARQAGERLQLDPGDPAALHLLHDFFHKVAGFAAQVDLHVLGRLAATCERAIDATGEGTFAAGAALARLIDEGLAGVAHVLDQHGTGPSGRPPLRSSRPEGLATPDATPSEAPELWKVLVVDDDEQGAALIGRTLRSAGFGSSVCTDPHQAMERIAAELPDLIILDVLMPGIDGFELCRRIRRHPAMQFTPILFVTRKGDVHERVHGLEVGANDYIPKPFDPAELVARVKSHLNRLSALREMAIRDGLTHCYNHKFFKLRLDQEMARARRYGQPLAVAMLDVDHFKRINDAHGHAAGDRVLAQIAELLRGAVRGTDMVARYGGEEFALLMVHAGANEARVVAERIHSRMRARRFEIDDAGGVLEGVTASIGVTELAPRDDLVSFLGRADGALYDAKAGGRDRVCVVPA